MMTDRLKSQRYIYKTQGVCPPEIHFQISQGVLTHLRFVGGGCPGNALLAGRLLKDRRLSDIMQLTTGIECRQGTSCPDQLACALKAVEKGQLSPAASFLLAEDPRPRSCIGLIGEVGGNLKNLKAIVTALVKEEAETIVCTGDLTGASAENRNTLKLLRQLGVQAIQGQNDWKYANGKEKPPFPPLDQQARDWLIQLPQVLSFRLGNKKGLAFFGDYIQTLPDYSDYEPFALEMNMVCGLTDFLRDETVFPALEAMTPQFGADVILFGQTKRWGHWQIGEKDFISIGPISEADGLSYGLLQSNSGKLSFKKMHMRRQNESTGSRGCAADGF